MEPPASLEGCVYYEHGSEDSIDVDRVYVVSTLPNFQECQRLCRTEGLINKNIVTVVEGHVRDCHKGLPDEINNGILATYALHKQAHPCIIAGPVRRVVLLRLLRGVRVILTRLTHTSVRATVKPALSSHNYGQRLVCLAAIDFTQLVAELNADDWKSLAFQIAQCYLLCTGIEIFTKSDVTRHFPSLAPLVRRTPDLADAVAHLNALRTRLVSPLIASLNYIYNQDRFLAYAAPGSIPEHMTALAEEARHGVVMDVKRERLVCYPSLPFPFSDAPPSAAIAITFSNHLQTTETLGAHIFTQLTMHKHTQRKLSTYGLCAPLRRPPLPRPA